MSDLPAELRTLVERYGSSVLDDADGLRATLDDFLDETSSPGEVNLLVDAVRFGSLDRLRTVLGQGADPRAATADVAEALAQRRGGDGDSAYWACAVLGYAADLLPGELIPGTWMRPNSVTAPSPDGATSLSALPPDGDRTYDRSRTQPFDADEQTQPSPAAQASVRSDHVAPADGNDTASGTAGDSRRKALWTRLAIAAVLVLVVVAVVVFLTRQRDASDSAAANQVPVADVLPAFDHFGPNGGLARALKTCGVAAVPGQDYEAYNCSFGGEYEAFDLALTEKDPRILDRNGQLPEVVRHPPSNTIVTSEDNGNGVHAYFLTWEDNGVDGRRNTSDDHVTMTLYDVDKKHPGAAMFSAKDSTQEPLTRDKANQLLLAIGAKSEQFPLPAQFARSQFAPFVQQLMENRPGLDCVRAFTVLDGEFEHNTCRDGALSLAFGSTDTRGLERVRHRYQGTDYTWSGSSSSGGRLITSQFGDSYRLYWDQDGAQVWGILSAKVADRSAKELLDYFKEFQGNPIVRASAT